MLFFLALIILVLVQLRRDIRIVDRLKPATLLRSPIKRAGLVFVLLLVVPILFVQSSGLGGSLAPGKGGLLALHAFVSFLISYTWYRYLTWLDSLERKAAAGNWACSCLVACVHSLYSRSRTLSFRRWTCGWTVVLRTTGGTA
jgi:hypothetical protein